MTCRADDITECDCRECRLAEDEWERDQGWDDRDRIAADDAERSCVLGAECLHHDPFHSSAECFDLEMAKAYMEDA